MTARERHRAGVAARCEPVCMARGLSACGTGGIDARLEADHLIEVRWIRDVRDRASMARVYRGADSPLLAVDLDHLIADARNGAWLCGHHNRLKATGFLRFPADRLDAEFWAFVTDYGLQDLAIRITD